MHIPRMMIFVALLSIGANALKAAGDEAQGQQLAQQCVACHGLDGNSSDPQYPKLAGQYADYLEQALRAYRDGQRRNPIMGVFARQLSDREITDLAAWYAAQDGLGNF